MMAKIRNDTGANWLKRDDVMRPENDNGRLRQKLDNSGSDDADGHVLNIGDIYQELPVAETWRETDDQNDDTVSGHRWV